MHIAAACARGYWVPGDTKRLRIEEVFDGRIRVVKKAVEVHTSARGSSLQTLVALDGGQTV